MSFVISDTSPVFTDPLEIAAPPPETNPTAVDATVAPVQIGGIRQEYTTTSAAPGQTAQVVVSGENTIANIGTGDALVQAVGGGTIVESIQSIDDAGSKTIKLGDPAVAYNGATVDEEVEVSIVTIEDGVATIAKVPIATAAGGQGGPFAYYAHGGIGSDFIDGSSLDDFIRGGAGSDNLNGFGGNDLIRGGTGSDTVFGGSGADTLYYTEDQFPSTGSQDTDTFADFETGTDKISIDRSVVPSLDNISGLGTTTISFSDISGSGTVQLVSGGTVINAEDIVFIP